MLDYLLLSEEKDIKLGPHKTIRGLWVLTPGLGSTHLRTWLPTCGSWPEGRALTMTNEMTNEILNYTINYVK